MTAAWLRLRSPLGALVALALLTCLVQPGLGQGDHQIGTTTPSYPRAASEEPAQNSHDRTPVPDPTRLTSQALREAIAALKDVIYTRLEGMDKALELLQKKADLAPTELDRRVESARALFSERFKGIELQFEGIQLQFKERDTRVEQTARDSKTAVDAALQAAKEAVEKQNAASSQAASKSELAFTKQIDQLAELFRTSAKSLEDKIVNANKVSDDKLSVITDRITRIESLSTGARVAKTDSADGTFMIIAVVGAVVGVAGLIIAVITSNRHPPRVVP